MTRKLDVRNISSLPAVTTMKTGRYVVVPMIWVICVSGFCPDKCKLKENNSTLPPCDIDTGACTRGCTAGYFGTTCNRKCDIKCQGTTCQQQDGLCTCKPGYKFNSVACEVNSGVKCINNDHCLSDMCVSVIRDDCLKDCKPGWFGKFCERPCPSKCVCDKDKESGNCTRCLQGWYGQECDSKCSQCMDKNCNRNGSCVDGCKPGSYGERCELKCSNHCVSGCDQLSGECVKCAAGRYGSTCQYECVSDNDGEVCESSCPQRCYRDVCDLTTGECTKGCQRGYYGSFCNLTCESCQDGDCDRTTGECAGKWMPYIIGGGLFLLFIVLAVFMACCLKRMRDIVKDGVDKIGQNTAVQFVPGHDTQLTSIEIGSAETNSCGPNPDDIYNHLFDIKPIETTFCLAADDLETSSGYCAVRPLFRGRSGIDEIDNGSDDCDAGSNIGRSLISLCDGNGSDGQDMKIGEANVGEQDQNSKPIEIVVLQPDKEERIPETIHVVTLPSDEEHLIQEETQIGVIASNEEGAFGGEQMEEEEETIDGCPTVDVGKHEEEEDDMTAVKVNNTDTDEGDSNNDDMSIQPPDKGQSMTPEGQHTKRYVEVKVMKQF